MPRTQAILAASVVTVHAELKVKEMADLSGAGNASPRAVMRSYTDSSSKVYDLVSPHNDKSSNEVCKKKRK